MRLTTKSIEHLKPAAQRREIPDSGCRGLYLIVQSSGARSWALRYRFDRRPTKLTLGSWPAVSLADARAAATQALRELAGGNDPAAARKEASVRAAAAKADTVVAVCEEYLKREGHRLRTVDQRVSTLRRLIYPVIGDRPISEVRRSEIVRLLDRIEDGSGQRTADATLSVLRRIFGWHALRADDFNSPIVRGMTRQDAKAHRRTRTLTDPELRSVWQATKAEELHPYGALVRLALLTSARRGELAGLRWDEIDGNGVWTLPAARSKTGVTVTRPLSKAALEIIEARPRFAGCDFIFTANGITPIRSFSDPKEKLDAAANVTGWRFHDLRRTARSLLSRAGINVYIAERCLGHAMAPIRDTYDKHRYLDEMRHAFEALATLIGRILNPQGDVIPLWRR